MFNKFHTPIVRRGNAPAVFVDGVDGRKVDFHEFHAISRLSRFLSLDDAKRNFISLIYIARFAAAVDRISRCLISSDIDCSTRQKRPESDLEILSHPHHCCYAYVFISCFPFSETLLETVLNRVY